MDKIFLFLFFLRRKKKNVSRQFFQTYGVIYYGSGWKKHVVNRCSEFVYKDHNVWRVHRPQCVTCTQTAMCDVYTDHNVWRVHRPQCVTCTQTAMCDVYTDHNVWCVQRPQCVPCTQTAMSAVYTDRNECRVHRPQWVPCTQTAMSDMYTDHNFSQSSRQVIIWTNGRRHTG